MSKNNEQISFDELQKIFPFISNKKYELILLIDPYHPHLKNLVDKIHTIPRFNDSFMCIFPNQRAKRLFGNCCFFMSNYDYNLNIIENFDIIRSYTSFMDMISGWCCIPDQS
jgi:hypothetical protein